MTYTFHEVVNCNMCNSERTSHKILGRRMNKSQGRSPHKKTGLTTSVVKCKNCGLVFSSPLPIPNDIQDHYGVPPESYWKPEYFKVHKEYFNNELLRLGSLLKFKPGMKSLDVGAGIGKVMIKLSDAGFDSYGIEASRPFYERAITEMKISNDKITCSKIEDAYFPSESFDFITFGAVLEHLYDPGAAIESALKWLKPSGIIHVEVPSSDWLINRLINIFYQIRGLDYVGNISPMHEPYHLYEFGLESFQRHAKRNNYLIAHYEYFVCETFMPRILDWIIKPYMRMTKTGMQLSIWLQKR